MSSFLRIKRDFWSRSSTESDSSTACRSWTSPVDTAAAKSASLSGSSKTLEVELDIVNEVTGVSYDRRRVDLLCSRKMGCSCAISLNTATSSDMMARTISESFLYGSSLRLEISVREMEGSSGCKKPIWDSGLGDSIRQLCLLIRFGINSPLVSSLTASTLGTSFSKLATSPSSWVSFW